jgi:hypothetical protein
LALIPNAWVSDPPGKLNAIVEVPVFSQLVVLPAVGGDPEPGRVALVVDPGDLGLRRAGEVLVDVVGLGVGGVEQVALVRVGGGAGAEVPGDHVVHVDPQQLVERRVGLVVQGSEGVCRRRRLVRRGRGGLGHAREQGERPAAGYGSGQCAGHHMLPHD